MPQNLHGPDDRPLGQHRLAQSRQVISEAGERERLGRGGGADDQGAAARLLGPGAPLGAQPATRAKMSAAASSFGFILALSFVCYFPQ